MRIIKILRLFLVLLLLTALISCGSESKTSGNDATSPENLDNFQNESLPTNTDAPIYPELPAADFGGKIYTILNREGPHIWDQFIAEEQNGDPINDALYLRKVFIEDRYNVQIRQFVPGDGNKTINAAKTSVKAGDNTYSLIQLEIMDLGTLANAKFLADWYEMPYINENLQYNWWDQNLNCDLTVNGKLYMQDGQLIIKDDLRLTCMYFNKGMFQEFNLEYPYQSVRDGKWTIDKMIELSKGINRDLDGNGVMDQYDQWGFMSEHQAGLHFYQGAGERSVTINKDGVPELTLGGQRSLNVIEKILQITSDPMAMFHADTIKGAADVWLQANAYFQEDRFLIRSSIFLPIVESLRSMETDFGIIPFPKFDEQQENYYSTATQWGYAVAFPKTADPEFAGFITEALARESVTTLTPAFYDVSLRTKYARDDESEDMLDIIFGNKIYDIGVLFSLTGLDATLSSMVSGRKTDFVSTFDKNKDKMQTKIEKFYESYQ